MSNIRKFGWKLGETVCSDWTWDEIQYCNPKAICWDWERMKRGELYPLPEQCIKVLILGSPEVGKSTLLWSFFDDCDGPTVSLSAYYGNCDLYLHNMEENGADIRVYFGDITKAKHFLELNEDIYRETSVIIYCYAVHDLQSLVDLIVTWIPLSRQYLGNVPSILVGNMTDVRDCEYESFGTQFISKAAGEIVKDLYGINRFYECCIEDGDTPQNIFQTALRLGLRTES